jgi:subtilase family serine protease
MRFQSLALCGVAFCALTAVSYAEQHRTAAQFHPQVIGVPAAGETTHFSLFLPLRNQAALEQLQREQTDPTSSNYHKWLTPAEFGEKFGPAPETFQTVKNHLISAGLTITKQHTQSIEVEGAVHNVEALLSTHLEKVQMADGKIKLSAANHKMVLPEELARVGARIPAFAPHLARHIHSELIAATPGSLDPGNRLSNARSWYYANDMVEAYDFPSFQTTVGAKQITGAGTTIGILMSSPILPADLAKEFSSGISSGSNHDTQNFTAFTTVPVPTVTIENIDGASSTWVPAADAAGEASLDTQMSLGTAPGAQEILYNIPDLNDSSIIDGYTQIVEDNTADVVSSSFGGCEIAYTAAANNGTDYTYLLGIEHNIYVQGNLQGITFLASSGDNGAVPCYPAAFYASATAFTTNYVLGVESPASDPNVTGVGGTNLITTASPGINDAKYSVENANYDPRTAENWGGGVTVGNKTWGSGGGYSIVFGQPLYQTVVNTGSTTARATPDVSLMMGGCPGDADLTAQNCEVLPRSAAIVWINGSPNLLIGTSSSSPQFAGVVALYDEAHGGRQGNINPLLYQLSVLQTSASAKSASANQFYHRTITGNNNGYTVVPGQAYSPVLGNGTLFVKNFLQLPNAAAAGTPSTPSNP